jgi:post-segregation antitoxin (ccd killing protein)
MSPRDIHAIIKEEEVGRQRYEHQQQRQELSSKAYKLFSEKKTTVVVAIALNLTEPRVSKMYREYCKLKRRYILNLIHKETNGKLGPFLKLYKQLIKEKRMSIEKIVSAVDIAANRLPHIESLYRQAKDEAEKMQCTIQRLANDIRALELKISTLDKTALSCELECKRTEQRVQELAIRKDRLEKLIAHVLNGGGYTKLKQIVKENVKAVLSNNKILLSASFAAVIQTLKTHPQTVNRY